MFIDNKTLYVQYAQYCMKFKQPVAISHCHQQIGKGTFGPDNSELEVMLEPSTVIQILGE